MEFMFINYKVKKQAEFVSGDSSWDNGYLWLEGVVKRKNRADFWGSSVLFLGLEHIYVQFVKIYWIDHMWFMHFYISMKSFNWEKKASTSQFPSIYLEEVNEYILGNQYNY